MKSGFKITFISSNATKFMLFLLAFWIGSMFVRDLIWVVLDSMGRSAEIFRSPWAIIGQQLFGLLLPLFIWLAFKREKFAAHMPNRPLGLVNIAIIILLSFLFQPGMMLVSGILSLFFTNDVAAMVGTMTVHPWWLLILAVAVTPGIVEELVFRGYIQSATPGRKFAKVAILNGFLFGIMHLSPHQFLYTFLLGVIFAYMVYITKSIWAGIISHFIVNASQVSFMYFTMRGVEDVGDVLDTPLTFAQEMYNSVVDIDPEMAQRLYDMLYGVRVEIVAIIAVGFFAMFTVPAAAGIFYWFVVHNRKRAALLAPPKVEAVAEDTALPRTFNIDLCLVATICVYVGFLIMLSLL